MPKRTIQAVYMILADGTVAHRGEEHNLSAADVARGEEHGAFAKGGPAASDALEGATGRNTPTQGGLDPSTVPGGDATVPSELSDEQIDALTGDDLDAAAEAAGIDTESGGSLSTGGLSADEKRAALRAYRDAE